MSRTFQGQLEIRDDGVVYFHEDATGATLLRIQYLPVPVPTPVAGEALDISLRSSPDGTLNCRAGFSWQQEHWAPAEQK